MEDNVGSHFPDQWRVGDVSCQKRWQRYVTCTGLAPACGTRRAGGARTWRLLLLYIVTAIMGGVLAGDDISGGIDPVQPPLLWDGTVGSRHATTTYVPELLRCHGDGGANKWAPTSARGNASTCGCFRCGARGNPYATAPVSVAVQLGLHGGGEEAGGAWPGGRGSQRGVDEGRRAAATAPSGSVLHHGGCRQGVDTAATAPSGVLGQMSTTATAGVVADHHYRRCQEEGRSTIDYRQVPNTVIVDEYHPRAGYRRTEEGDRHDGGMDESGDGQHGQGRRRRRPSVPSTIAVAAAVVRDDHAAGLPSVQTSRRTNTTGGADAGGGAGTAGHDNGCDEDGGWQLMMRGDGNDDGPRAMRMCVVDGGERIWVDGLKGSRVLCGVDGGDDAMNAVNGEGLTTWADGGDEGWDGRCEDYDCYPDEGNPCHRILVARAFAPPHRQGDTTRSTVDEERRDAATLKYGHQLDCGLAKKRNSWPFAWRHTLFFQPPLATCINDDAITNTTPFPQPRCSTREVGSFVSTWLLHPPTGTTSSARTPRRPRGLTFRTKPRAQPRRTTWEANSPTRRWTRLLLQTIPLVSRTWTTTPAEHRKRRRGHEGCRHAPTNFHDVDFLFLVTLAEAIAAITCAMTTIKRRTMRCAATRCDDGDIYHRCRRRPARRVGKAREVQRRADIEPGKRIRALCRKAETLMVIYLMLTNHIMLGRGIVRGQLAQESGTAMYPAEGQRGSDDGTTDWHWTAHDRDELKTTTVQRSATRWWTEGARIGEARHPGPAAATIAIGGALRRIYGTARAAISYPRPGTGCLRGAVAPGYARSDWHRDGGSDDDLFALRIEAVNTTGWRALQRRLLSTEAHALLAQETWLSQDAIPAASAWAKRRGWHSIWAPAVAGPRGGASGGVAIFARESIGLRFPEGGSHVLYPGRAVAAVLEPPAHRPLLLVSSYLCHGVGPNAENLELLAAIGTRVQQLGAKYDCVMGGDINMEPPDFAATGFEAEVDAVVMAPSTARGTFRNTKTASLLDFFIVSNRLAAAVDRIVTIEATGVKGHTPVLLAFKPRVTTLRALHLRKPPDIGKERVYGPIPPPPDWSLARRRAEDALASARSGRGNLQELLDDAYREWANLAEREIADYTGRDPKKWGERGRLPNLVWRSVVREATPKLEHPRAAAAAWLAMTLREVARIANAVTTTGGSGDQTAAFAVGEDPAEVPDGVSAADFVDQEVARARGRKPPTSRRACAAVLDEIITSLGSDMPHCGEGEEADAIAAAHTRAVEEARRLREVIGDIDADDAAISGDNETDDRDGADDRRDLCADIFASLDQLGTDVADLEARFTAEAKAEDQKQWRDWVSEGIDGGAARAHAYTRLPRAWTPSTVQAADGTLSSAVDDLMEDQREKYRRLWKPADHPYHYVWEDEEELPLLEVESLRATAGTFATRTSTTYDGFHPRALGHLSDEALSTLAVIYAAVERAGIWPRQVSLIVAALLPKPAGGFRPIGMAPAIYRLWAKARRSYGDEWEQRHHRSYFSATKGNGPVDTLWRLSARQEAGVAAGEVAATVSEDLKAFFEAVDRERLVREARALGFPVPIVRAALAQYASGRMLSMGGRICREMYPTTGVVAGCSLAMVLTKIYLLRALDEYVSTIPPEVALDTHVDDFTLSAIGKEAAVLEDIMDAHSKLKEAVEGTLDCSFAEGKTAVTATTRNLAAAITRRLGIAGGVAKAATLLGVDNTAAAPRASLRCGSKKSRRLKAALARRKRLQQVQKVVGSRARKVFVAGVRPAATHGAQIWGLDDAEIGKLRRLAAAALRPQARGRSLGLTLLWHDLPTAAAEAAPLLQLSRMIWHAVVRRQDAISRGSSLADLRRWWAEASNYFAPLAEQMLSKAAELNGADLPTSFTRRLWKQVRGPLGAAALTAARIGWRFDGIFTIWDEEGAETLLTNTSPRLLGRNATEAIRKKMERRAAHGWADEEPQYHGRRACLDLVTAEVRNGKHRSGFQRGVMRSATCGAIMTEYRALRLGYKVTGMCPLCQGALDTLTHRVYGCPCTASAVKAVVPPWFWEEAARTAQGNRFWTTGICPDPGDLAPQPPTSLDVKVKILDEAVREENGELIAIGGRAYFDGSCTAPAIRSMARASCAVVQTDENGRPVKALQAAVPRHLPQTAQAAEHLGLGITVHALRRSTAVVGDCLSVVKAANGACREVLAATRMYAGILLAANAVPERRRLAGTIQWTRAHRTATGEESESERRDIRGNAAADEEARDALGEHPQLGALAEGQLRYYERRIKHVVDAVTTALALFPRASGKMQREERPLSAEQAQRRRRHHWQYKGGAWRCTLCNDWRHGDHLPRARVHQRCAGKTLIDEAGTMAKRGHQLYQAEADLPFIYCRLCGAWGHRRTRRLSSACGPPAASGSQALARIRRGFHPLQRRGPLGILLPRERIRTIGRYCTVSGAWTRMDDAARAYTGRTNDDDMMTDTRDNGLEAATIGEDIGAVGSEVPSPRRLSQRVTRADATCREDDRHGEVDERSDEEDVFGHGGGLEAHGDDDGNGLTRSSGVIHHDDAPTAGSGGGGQPAMTWAARSEAAANTRRGARSIREVSAQGTTDAAVRRLMERSRPSGVDAAAKLRAIRDRVRARCRGEPVTATISATGAAAEADNEVGIVDNFQCDVVSAAEEDPDARNVRRRVEHRQSDEAGLGSEANHAAVELQDGEPAAGSTADCTGGTSGGKGSLRKDVLAINAHGTISTIVTSVNVAREGPGDPPPSRSTETVTQPSLACVADTVAGGGVVATLTTDDYARDGDSDRGEATYGPPRGAAAPREDNRDTLGELQGRDYRTTSQKRPLAAGGGRPQKRHARTSPQELPASLGAGPSNPGRDLRDEEGGRPARRGTERRREGGVAPQARAEAARGSGGAATASMWEMPLRGIRRRVPDARSHGCQSNEPTTTTPYRSNGGSANDGSSSGNDVGSRNSLAEGSGAVLRGIITDRDHIHEEEAREAIGEAGEVEATARRREIGTAAWAPSCGQGDALDFLQDGVRTRPRRPAASANSRDSDSSSSTAASATSGSQIRATCGADEDAREDHGGCTSGPAAKEQGVGRAAHAADPWRRPQSGATAARDRWEATGFSHHRGRGAARAQHEATMQPQLRHQHGGTCGNEGDPPGTVIEQERRIDLSQFESSSDRHRVDNRIRVGSSFSSNANSARAARDPLDADHPRARCGLGGADAAAPGAAHGDRDRRGRGHGAFVGGPRSPLGGAATAGSVCSPRTWTAHAGAADEMEQLQATEFQSSKRRRLRGKQPPSGGMVPTVTGAAIGDGITGLPHRRAGHGAFNSVHEVISACPPRSATSSFDRLAPEDRGGQVLGARPAAAASLLASGLAQFGAGRTERDRGRGRPPEP